MQAHHVHVQCSMLHVPCTTQAGTYWLMRAAGGDELKLYDITEYDVAEQQVQGTSHAGTGHQAHAGGGAAEGCEEAASSAEERAAEEAAAQCTPASATGDTAPSEAGGAAAGSAAAGGAAAARGAAAGGAAARRPPAPRQPFGEPVALLCWRIAEKLTAPEEAPRRRRLLEACLSRLEAEAPGRTTTPMAGAAREARTRLQP
jgi:hypothetical protein